MEGQRLLQTRIQNSAKVLPEFSGSAVTREKNMQNIARYLRNKRMDILLIAAFVMVAFVVSNVGNLMLRIQGEVREKSADSYKNRKEFCLYSTETENIPVRHMNELCEVARGTECKITAQYALRVGDEFGTYAADVILQEPGTSDVKLLLGEAWRKYTYEQEGKQYIYLAEVACEVSAFLPDKSVSGHDERIMLYYDRAPQELRNVLDRTDYSITFRIESNSDISDVCRQLCQCWEKEYGLEIEAEECYETPDTLTILYLMLNKTFVTVLFVFVLIHSIMISELWISTRKKELVIRRAYGYSRGRIVCYVLKKFAQFMLTALGIELLLQLLYQLICGGIPTQSFWERQGLTVLGMMAVVLFVLMIHMFRLTGLNVAELIREE